MKEEAEDKFVDGTIRYLVGSSNIKECSLKITILIHTDKGDRSLEIRYRIEQVVTPFLKMSKSSSENHSENQVFFFDVL